MPYNKLNVSGAEADVLSWVTGGKVAARSDRGNGRTVRKCGSAEVRRCGPRPRALSGRLSTTVVRILFMSTTLEPGCG